MPSCWRRVRLTSVFFCGIFLVRSMRRDLRCQVHNNETDTTKDLYRFKIVVSQHMSYSMNSYLKAQIYDSFHSAYRIVLVKMLKRQCDSSSFFIWQP